MINIKDLARDLQPCLVEWRRHFHRYPELSWQEHETSQTVARMLTQIGIPIRKAAGTGVIGSIAGKKPLPVVALRADMDALPVLESSDIPFCSQNAGIMHACGHDAHTAMLLGAAHVLSQCRDAFCGEIRLIFQPAEEDLTGARAMIAEGVLKDAGAIFGLHVWSHLDAGKIAIDAGPRMASADKFVIRVRGKGGHGAAPHHGIDAIPAAASVIANLQTIVSRHTSPFETLVITIGKISGGTAFNVLCAEVEMEGTVRCMKPGIRDQIPEAIERVVVHSCGAHRAEGRVEYITRTPVVVNDSDLSQIARTAAEALFGPDVLFSMGPSIGSEDFAWYGEKVPAVFAFLGTGKSRGNVAPHHSPGFDLDESVLWMGTALYAKFAMDCLGVHGGYPISSRSTQFLKLKK